MLRRPALLCALALTVTACEAGGIGDPCVPEEEYRTDFSGFSEKEVSIELRSFQCETRVCLVNHFRGRVSCPYGQSEADLDQWPTDDERRCRIPGAGDAPEDAIRVPVAAQLQERPPRDSVYCSCRCDGPDPNANYCECPSGYSCEQLVDEFGLGREGTTGSYCVRNGTSFSESTDTGTTCDRELNNCDERT